MSRKHLHRRTLLRGALAGVTAAIALPSLEAMLDQHGEAFADGTGLPVRFLTWFFGNGVRLDRFVPGATGPQYPLSEQLMPLQSVRDYVSVLTGFDSRVPLDDRITHHEGMVIFSGHNNRDINKGDGFFSNAGGPTVDQLIANLPSVGDQTPIRSVQVGVSKRPSQIDFGTTMNNLSHRAYLQPLPPEHNPQEIYKKLFDSFTPQDHPEKPLRLSVLDITRDHAARLNKRLGKADKDRLAAHLDGIRELEKKINAIAPLCAQPELPGEANVDVGGREPLVAVAEAMSDLLVYAFRCDITRVASFLFAEGAGNTIYADLGQDEAFHELTHRPSQTIQDEEVHEGVIYAMERFGYLLERLRDADDGAGNNLLDDTLIFCSTDCAEGQSHSVSQQPMLIAGRAGGKVVHPGIHYASASGENPSDVLLTCLQCFDETATTVGAGVTGSTTPFGSILSS